MRIGILGFGLVGKSVLSFLRRTPAYQKSAIYVWDGRTLSASEMKIIQRNDAVLVGGDMKDLFASCDIVIPSPGIDMRCIDIRSIDIRPCASCSSNVVSSKIVSELDLFAAHFTKKTIAITGTLGKTSVTTLLGDIVPYRCAVGGNIGTPMLDLLTRQDDIEYAILELSSFQLEYSSFAPDIAVLTNIYPNHIDRHGSMQNYFAAKYNLFAHGAEQAVVPIGMKNHFLDYPGDITYFGNESVLYTSGYRRNWQCIAAVMRCLGHEMTDFRDRSVVSAHRLECFTTIDGVDFYNDSKATVMQATMEAVRALRDRPIILILGGVDKGVDRSSLVSFLADEPAVRKVFCLGEGKDFACYDTYASIENLTRAIMQEVRPGDQVLFSPSGASFDMFLNYKKRGEAFKREILKFYE